MQKHYLEKLQRVMKRIDASFFFYDLDQLSAHLSHMSSIVDSDITLWYACKANPMSAILKVLRNLNFGIDIASVGELSQVLNVGVSQDFILATGPAKSKDYLRHLLHNGIKFFVLESINQARWLNEVAQELNERPQALLRVQLDWPDGESVLGGNAVTPFGLGPSDWRSGDVHQFTQIDIRGFHVFQWGNILSLERLKQIWTTSIKAIKQLAHDMNCALDILDLGGGLGIPYCDTETSLNFNTVHTLLLSLKKKYQLKKIWLELGRYSVGACGFYLTKVVDKKTVRNSTIVIVEGGINHLARPALTKQSFPCNLLRESAAQPTQTMVCGPLCTALDHLGTYPLPSDVEVGDWLVFSMTGAYGFTESLPYFLCHPLAGEVTYYKGDMMIPRPPKNSFEWMI